MVSEAGRPRGLARFSHRRHKERFEANALDVRAAHAELVVSIKAFLIGT